MPTNDSSPEEFDENTPWQALYEQAADYGNDFVTEVRSAVDYGMSDPEDTVQMACAAAETAEAAAQALSHEWALYTPQQAATVAAALFAQMQATAKSLRTLHQATGHIAEFLSQPMDKPGMSAPQ